MSKFKSNTVLAGAIAMAFAGGSALAGGPVGVMPFDGDGSGAGFTIDNAGFDGADVDAAPCPVGATCTNMTATTDNEILMREVDAGGQRYIQTILVDGSFTYESSVGSEGAGDSNSIGTKYRIDGGGMTSNVALYRGALFGASSGNSFAMEMDQTIGAQTTTMETLLVPNVGNQPFRNGIMQITQLSGVGGMGRETFGHTIVAGSYLTAGGTLTAGSESFTYAAGDSVSATWIGGTMAGGGPGVILAPGQTQNHDTRTADQRDFGLLVYRHGTPAGPGNVPPAVPVGMGNAGGGPGGIVEPQFTQQAVNAEARAFSATGVTDTNDMYNINHGSFVGGAAILANDWDDTVFGANPY